MAENETPIKDFELAFVRKRDGKIVNVKLYEIFRKFKTVDFINNEVVLDGEVLVADSVRYAYYEVDLNVVLKSSGGGSGSFNYNGVNYNTNQVFKVEKDSMVNITIVPAEGSTIESVTDELGNPIEVLKTGITITMNTAHTVNITFALLPV
jgi:hypothetical protein